MSELDDIKQHLNTSRDAIRAAAETATRAETTLREKFEEFAGLGLEGVANILDSARQGMETAAAMFGTAHAAGDGAVSELRNVTDTSKITDTLTALDGAMTKIDESAAGTRSAAAEADDANGLACESEVEAAIDACATAITTIAEARQLVAAAHKHTEQYRQKIDAAAKAALTGGGHASNSAADACNASGFSNLPGPGSRSRAYAPPEAIARYKALLPARRKGDPTTGFAIWPDGSAVKVQSSTQRTNDFREGLVKGWRSMVPQHAEGMGLWQMRKAERNQMVIVQNKAPCDYPNVGCEATIRQAISTGAVVTIIAPDEHGQETEYHYVGTGEAIDNTYRRGVE